MNSLCERGVKRALILTGWGRSDYAVAAAVALRAIGEADALGVSMRRLADVLEKESVGRVAVYVLGIGLGNETEAFVDVAQRLATNGTAVSYLSMFKMDDNVRSMMEIASVKLGVFPKAESLAEVVEMFFGVEAGDFSPILMSAKKASLVLLRSIRHFLGRRATSIVRTAMTAYMPSRYEALRLVSSRKRGRLP